jgi:hypothetical protein
MNQPTPSSLAHVPQGTGFGATMRKDAWWLAPLGLAALLLSFVVYSTVVAFEGGYHWVNGTGYLSPFYSPEIFGFSPHALIKGAPSWWPSGLMQFSSAFLILMVPAGFRFTCYYYRKAYYRSIWLDPVACAVGEPRSTFLGENSLPLILLNVHRYFLYLAIVLGFILLYDGIHAFFFPVAADGSAFQWTNAAGTAITGKLYGGATIAQATGEPAHWKFGIGLGSIILLINPLLIMGYTFGCHSLRHLVGGKCDSYNSPCGDAKYKAWSVVTALNKHHDKWAMASLVWVGLSDAYVRLCAHGVITDVLILSPFTK